MIDLEAPYVPTPVYLEHSRVLEYVTADVPTVVRQVDARFSILLDMSTREPIGFRVEAPYDPG